MADTLVFPSRITSSATSKASPSTKSVSCSFGEDSTVREADSARDCLREETGWATSLTVEPLLVEATEGSESEELELSTFSL